MFRTLSVIFCALVLLGAGTKILGSADGEMPGTRIDVSQLKRISGNMVSLHYILVNDTNTEIGLGDYMDGSDKMHDSTTIAGVYLDDGTTKYTVVRDAQNACVCSSGLKSIHAKSKMNLWAKFPAPPASVKKLTIDVPHFAPVEDVPLTPISE